MLFNEKKIRLDKVETRDFGYTFTLALPSGLTVEQFQKYLPALEQDTFSKVRFKIIKGRHCSIDFGRIDLRSNVAYSDNLPKKGLQLPFYSHFGWKKLDFWREDSWHFLVAGATGMGKSALIRYILVHLLLSVEGHINFYISSNKITDFHMFRNIHQFSFYKTELDTLMMLEEIITEAERREKLIAHHNVLDVRELREKKIMDLVPIFVVLDEYGRLADSNEVQDRVQHIIETFRYVDVHVIISTQRPDATTAIRPRIRANILASLALSVRDESNSRMIVGTNEAAKLGRIAGRAILSDGFTTEVQVPYLTEDKAKTLLKSYYGSGTDEERKRHDDCGIVEEVSSIEPSPVGEISVQRKQKPPGSRKPSHETAKPGRKNHSYSKTKRNVLPIYAEPDYHSPDINKN